MDFKKSCIVLCFTHDCTQYTHLNTFQTSARTTETFHVLPSIATQLFPYHMFGLPFPLNCFHSTACVCILCAFTGCVKIIPCNFNSTFQCSNRDLWPLLGVCNGKNDICARGWYAKISCIVCVDWHFISWENLGTCSHNCHDPQPTAVHASHCNFKLSLRMLGWPKKFLILSTKSRILVYCF